MNANANQTTLAVDTNAIFANAENEQSDIQSMTLHEMHYVAGGGAVVTLG